MGAKEKRQNSIPVQFNVLSYARNQGLTFHNGKTYMWDLLTLRYCCLVLQVFVESSMPVIKHYEGKGKLRRFDATPPPSEVFEKVKKLFVETPASVL